MITHVFKLRSDSSFTCTLKIRVYKKAKGIYVVEFQRRSGDGIFYNTVYRWGVQYMTQVLAEAAAQAIAL